VDAWLERCAVAPEDRAYLREIGIERLSVYRRLIRGTLRGTLQQILPRVVARLGNVFDEYFDRYLAERGPTSRYLRDLPPDFLDFCREHWNEDARVPDYMSDLGHHEAVQLAIAAEPARPPDHEPGELALDRGVEFIRAATLVHYRHALHLLSESIADRTEPVRKDTWLFVYRSPDHQVRYLELTPLAAGILERLLNESQTLQHAITAACTARNVAMSQSVIEGTATVLADLAERGALLGAQN
jgi:hypothetical protein